MEQLKVHVNLYVYELSSTVQESQDVTIEKDINSPHEFSDTVPNLWILSVN